ncbi:MAG: cyclic nucleotide-binding domain-containing protein, partial [Alphaproteobacteria bacterium]
ASGSVMTAGTIFGWAALLEAQPRRLATATCLEPSRVLAINGRALLQIFDRDTAAGYTVMRRLAAMIARNFMETLSS